MKFVEQIREKIGELDELIASHQQIIKEAEIAKQTYESAISISNFEEDLQENDKIIPAIENLQGKNNIPANENPKAKYKKRKTFREGSRPYKAQRFLLECGKPMTIPEISKACGVSKTDYRSFGSGLADKSRAGKIFVKMSRGVYGLIELMGNYG